LYRSCIYLTAIYRNGTIHFLSFIMNSYIVSSKDFFEFKYFSQAPGMIQNA